MKTIVSPMHIFAEIQRVDEATRTVDAYAFVNEVVEGEGGIRLKRTAMEAATPDYMQWANVRRMHQPDAVAVARSVDWDDKGARMIVEVVDNDAWDKVQRGVYKGLSVGVAATVMRGKDVEACRWFETSLVDRPRDPDAKILAFRAEGVPDQFEAEVEEEEPVERVDAPVDPPATEPTFDILRVEVPADLTDEQVAELSERFRTIVTRSPIFTETLARAETAEGEITRVQGLLSTAESEIKRLNDMPAKVTRPVKFPGAAAALERSFEANSENDGGELQLLSTELKRLQDETPQEPDEQKRMDNISRMLGIRNRIASLTH